MLGGAGLPLVLGGQFAPDSIPGLWLWYNFDLPYVTLTAITNLVSAVFDASGTNDPAKNLTSGVGTQFTYNQANSGFNFKPTLSCAVAGPVLLGGAALAVGTVAQPVTWYSACTVTGVHPTRQIAVIYGPHSADSVGESLQTNSAAGAAPFQWLMTEVVGGNNSSFSTATQPAVICSIFDEPNNEIYINNHTTSDHTAAMSGSDGVKSICVGGDDSGFGGQFIGTLCEIIAYTGHHNAQQRNIVMGYLANKFNITVT